MANYNNNTASRRESSLKKLKQSKIEILFQTKKLSSGDGGEYTFVNKAN